MLSFKPLVLLISVVGCFLLTLTLTSTQDPIPTPAASKLIPRKILFGNPIKTSPKISPNGSKLAYLAPDENNVLNVWVKDLLNPGEDVKVTSEKKRGITSYTWQFDQSHILYVQDKDGDENWHLYQTNILTKETKNLTPYDGVKVDILAYEPSRPNELLFQMNLRDRSVFDVYRLNLTTNELKLDTENPDKLFNWTADHQLNVRAALSYTKDGHTLIHVRDQISAPWRILLTIDANETVGDIAGFSADDQALYLLSSLDGETIRLLKVVIATGQQSLVVEHPQFDLSEVMINPLTHDLEAVGLETERYDWIVLDTQLKPDFQFLSDTLHTPLRIINTDLENQNWIVASISDQRPTDFYLYNRSKKELTFLFNTLPVLKNYTLSPITPVSFQARDGMQLHGYLTLPVGKTENLPTVLFVHGGPWSRDSWGFSPAVQWFANRGYAVLQINYRGSTGYGKKYLNAGNKEWSGKMHTDLLDGKQWAVQNGFANPNKIAIYGGSYGGYATLVGLAFTPDEFCCGVDIVGPSNLITLLQTFPPYWSSGKAKMDKRVGTLESEQDFLKECSPLFKADKITKPLLIAQGANDPRVKQAESDQIVQAMRDNKLPVDYLLFPDEGHGFKRPENRMKFYAAAEEFLAKYLGGLQEPASPEENWDALKR